MIRTSILTCINLFMLDSLLLNYEGAEMNNKQKQQIKTRHNSCRLMHTLLDSSSAGPQCLKGSVFTLIVSVSKTAKKYREEKNMT